MYFTQTNNTVKIDKNFMLLLYFYMFSTNTQDFNN